MAVKRKGPMRNWEVRIGGRNIRDFGGAHLIDKYMGTVEATSKSAALSKARRVFNYKDLKVTKLNPARRAPRRKTARRKNAPKSQSKLLKNFTGVVRLNADKTVSIVGHGKKPNPSKKRRAKR